MKPKDKKLRRLLEKATLDTPSAQFTENLLEYLDEEMQTKILDEPDLLRSLDNQMLAAPSPAFTNTLMNQIETEAEIETVKLYAPLIPKRIGAVTGISCIVFYFFLANFSQMESSKINPNRWVLWVQELGSVSYISTISLLSLFMVLLLDFFYKTKFNESVNISKIQCTVFRLKGWIGACYLCSNTNY